VTGEVTPLRSPAMGSTARLAGLLRERGAEDVAHPGGTLHGHLERVPPTV
jgi:hypothetical protein